MNTIARFFQARGWLRPTTILLALLAQGAAAVFFVGDSLSELAQEASRTHAMAELPVAFALCLGFYFTLRELSRLMRHTDEQDRILALASMAFLAVVQQKFDLWRLTASEKQVAWLTLKGLELGEIAAKRQAASGTVRAQLARIYEKSGVSSRAQFVSLFLDELTGRLDADALGEVAPPLKGVEGASVERENRRN